jgi:transcriptional regulator with XRE-family HTH domain
MAAKLDYCDPYKPELQKELRARVGNLYKPEFLKELRTRVGMTQPRLGKLAGFSRDDIANFERGLSHLAINDAVKIYEALATVDQSGDAISAALLAAVALTESRKNTVVSAWRELEEKKKYVKAAQGWLQKARSDEKRIRALKAKGAIEGKPK